MLVGMSYQTFLLTPASGAEANAATFGNLATVFASTSATKSPFTLPVTQRHSTLCDTLHLNVSAIAGNSHLTLARTLIVSPGMTVLPDHCTTMEAATIHIASDLAGPR
jgi:hypothetical protein